MTSNEADQQDAIVEISVEELEEARRDPAVRKFLNEAQEYGARLVAERRIMLGPEQPFEPFSPEDALAD